MPKFKKSSVPRPQMEVYTSSHAKSWGYNALPGPVTTLYSLIMCGSVTGLAYFAGDKWGDGQGTLWSIIAISVMTVIGLIVMGIRARKAKKEHEAQGEGFESALHGSASGWDDTINVNDPAEIARLDDMRNNFQKGIQTFREYGKDIYSLPWYVIVGEPGSGKTEAIRRSELRFPDALQDKLQGTGGTYSMHWWFTNQAVILDTAGAVIMQPEAAARFEEFLQLLRTHRPACPINGMILTIPTDSLLADTPQAAEQKARTIAAQLALIQKALDVRFPIYLMISKSDRLPGFREFFDAEGQAGFERQMVGWSNPAPLGEAFAPEGIYNAIETIAQRLQSRSLALLSDPISPNPAARRMDEVDALYSFPHVLRSLAPRLKLYLDIIFQTGTWATKPPFFRGLYFTSALREGAQLDQQLAQALGMSLNQLPPGGFFTREKSVFLRDLFMEKVFQESGLVTRLFDIGAHLRKRLTTFYGATAALLVLALGLAWVVKDRIESQLARDQQYWADANGTWNNGSFLPVVTRSNEHSEGSKDRPAWSWTANQPMRDGATATGFLKDIQKRVYEPVNLSWVFSPVREWRDFLVRRQQGFLTLFEGSVMKPVLDAARERILWDTAVGATTGDETQQRMARAYAQLLLLETWLDKEAAREPDEKAWQEFFTHLLTYILDPAPPGGVKAVPETEAAAATPASSAQPVLPNIKDLVELATSVYGKRIRLTDRAWMSESSVENLPLEESALAKAADFLFGNTRQAAENNEQRKAEIQDNKNRGIARIAEAEKRLLQMSEEKPNGPRQIVEIEGMQPLREAVLAYMDVMKNDGGMPRSALSMELVTESARKILDAADVLGANAPEGLLHAATAAKKQKQDGTAATAAQSQGDNAWVEASKRLTEYDKSFKAAQVMEANLSLENMVGNLAQKLKEASAKSRELEGPAAAAPAGGDNAAAADAEKIAAYLRKFRGTPLIASVFTSYHQALLTYLNPRLKFPLVLCDASYDSLYIFETECNNLKKVEKDIQDIQTLTEAYYQCDERQQVDRVFEKLMAVFSIRQAVLGGGESGRGGLKIEMDAVEPPKQMSKQEEIPDPAMAAGFPAAPAGPKASMIQTIAEGFISLKITVGGSIKAQGPPTGENKTVPYNGFDPVQITLRFARPAPANEASFDYASPVSKWALLRQMAQSGKNKFSISASGKSFTIVSSPSLPAGQWPKRTELGLPPEPPR